MSSLPTCTGEDATLCNSTHYVPMFTMHYMQPGTLPEQPAYLVQRERKPFTNNSHNKCSGCTSSFSSMEAEGKNYFDKVANIPIPELRTPVENEEADNAIYLQYILPESLLLYTTAMVFHAEPLQMDSCVSKHL